MVQKILQVFKMVSVLMLLFIVQGASAEELSCSLILGPDHKAELFAGEHSPIDTVLGLNSGIKFFEQNGEFNSVPLGQNRTNPDFAGVKGTRAWIYKKANNNEIWIATTDFELGSQRVVIRFYRRKAQDKLDDAAILLILEEAKKDLGHILNRGFYFQDKMGSSRKYLAEADFRIKDEHIGLDTVLYEVSFRNIVVDPYNLTSDFAYALLNRMNTLVEGQSLFGKQQQDLLRTQIKVESSQQVVGEQDSHTDEDARDLLEKLFAD